MSTIKRQDDISIFRKGFTLIELLVVISIIAVLLSILMPALQKAKEQARSLVFRVNLRSIGISIAIYNTGYDEAMPMLYERSYGAPNISDPETEGRGYTWAGLLLNLGVMEMTEFRCPTDRRNYELTKENFWMWDSTEGGSGDFTTGFQFDYGAWRQPGSSGTEYRIPRSLPESSTYSHLPSPNVGRFLSTSIRKPAQMALVLDDSFAVNYTYGMEIEYEISWLLAMGDFLTLLSGLPGTTDYRKIIYRHARDNEDIYNGPNTYWADGHVEKNTNYLELKNYNLAVPKQ